LYPRTITVQEILDGLFGAGVFIRLLKAFQCAQIPTASVLQWGNGECGEILGGFWVVVFVFVISDGCIIGIAGSSPSGGDVGGGR
jgi:hypothetical protein